MLFSADVFFDAIVILITVLVCIISFYKWRFTFWKKHGIPILHPEIPFGNTRSFFLRQETYGKVFEKLYNEAKAEKLKHVGIYSAFSPKYMPIDNELVKNIMQRDFSYFVNHGVYLNEEDDPLDGHLFNLRDSKWRKMRIKLTPTFTSGKIKMMFQTLADCSHGLKDILDNAMKDQKPIDTKDVLGRFTTDIIGSVGFGIDCNSLKNPETEFRIYGRKAFEIDTLRALLMHTLPEHLLKIFKLKKTPNDVENFFMKVIKETIEYREKNRVYRKDFMHMLIQLKNLGQVTDDGRLESKDHSKTESLTFEEVAAQAFAFFIAGFETSSTLMTFALFELAQNQDVQTKLRNEINTILSKHNNHLTYDCINEMKYLEHVLQESLRKHPPLSFLPRLCSKDYHIPELSATIPRGTKLVISVLGIHYDPDFYPNPQKFEPERFSEENKAKRPSFTWLPFGEGPRLCIGMRFGLMQSKVGLVTLLKENRLTINEKTKLPMEYDKNSFILSIDGGLWLNVEKINN